MKLIYKQIEDYLSYCQKVRKMSEATLRAKRYILLRFANETNLKDLRKLSNSIYDSYTARLLQNEASERSINTYNATIITFVKYHKELGLTMPFQPMLAQKLKETKVERKFYTEKEIVRVVKVAEAKIGLMIQIMFETGMRIAEITNLRLADFDGQRICFIGKGQKLREVYIRAETLERVKKYAQDNNIRDFLWGISLNGEPPTTHTVRKKLQQTFRAAGFTDFYPHALRHSFATNLQLKGASVAEIKEMMGHSSIATTERYLHGFDGRMRELFEKYS